MSRDFVVDVPDGNYKMMEVARITPPEDAGPPKSITIEFERSTAPYRPTSIRVDYWGPGS